MYDLEPIKRVVDECLEDIAGDAAVNGFMYNGSQGWLKLGDAGFIMLMSFNSTYVEFHPFIKKSHRNLSNQAIKAFIVWAWDWLPKTYRSLITKSPASYRHVSIMCARFGFKKTGKIENAFLKNGEYEDINIYQLSRAN